MEDFMICVRADAPFTTKGSTFNRRCSVCRERVMVAPSGERLLAKRAAEQIAANISSLSIICGRCFDKKGLRADDFEVCLPDTVDAVRAEISHGMPNPWRQRH